MAVEVKSSGIAIVLSFFWTGLGQLYAGRIGRGLVMMVATPIIWVIAFSGGFAGCLGASAAIVSTPDNPAAPSVSASVGLVGMVLMIVPVFWWLWGMIDAKKLCDAHNVAQP